MGSGASSIEIYRRRALIRHFNQDDSMLLTTKLQLAIEQLSICNKYLTVPTIAHLLQSEFHIEVSIDELKAALIQIGSEYDSTTDTFNTTPLIALGAPREFQWTEYPTAKPFKRKELSNEQELTIWFACKMGKIELVKSTVQNNSRWHERDGFDNIPLYYACLCGHSDIVEFLLSTYKQQNISLPEAERLRCATNALSGDIKRMLQNMTSRHTK
ncbi:hypothetical protein THRCLA_20872 [Thraustotheca clavata]|uniref:Uncharacterized protein n=1 Tax=Thraustotheca clavata TaxID=74557 RepID=A0A1W0A2J8_9STRA|nr:hypothetical protein THRCLA_20872 [Thraustotheca clavata]